MAETKSPVPNFMLIGPGPANIKFDTFDYVDDITRMPKFKAIAPVGRPGTWVKYHSRVVFNFCDPKFAHFRRTNRRADFTMFDSLDVNSRLLDF